MAARRRWRSWLAFALLIGLLTGSVLAALAASRRTESVYPRFLRATHAFDVLLTNGGTTPTNLNQQFEAGELAALPQVREMAEVQYYFPEGEVDGRPIRANDLAPLASADGVFGGPLNRATAISGRLPESRFEVAVTPLIVDTMGVDVGDTLHLALGGPEDLSGAATEPPPLEEFEVVGVAGMHAGFPPMTGGLPPPLLLSTDYARSNPDAAQIFAFRLEHGAADVVAFQSDIGRLAGGQQIVLATQGEFASGVERSLAVDADALRLVAGLGALVVFVLLVQALIRQALAEVEVHQALHRLGLTRWNLLLVSAARVAVVAALAAAAAAITATALSSLTPPGVARQAEVDPGVRVDGWVLLAGTAAVFLVVSVVGMLAAAWSTGRALSPVRGASRRPSSVAEAVTRMGLTVPWVSGVRMALERQPGRGAARTAVATTALGVTVGVGLLTFTASLGHLLARPAAYGWAWDAQVGDAFAGDLGAASQRLARDPAVTTVATGSVVRLEIDGARVDTIAVDTDEGIAPLVIDGRVPADGSDIALGGRTMRDLDVGVGDTVSVGSGSDEQPMIVVGQAVLPEFGGSARLGEGAAVTFEAVERLFPEAVRDVILLRLEPGADAQSVIEADEQAAAAGFYLPSKPSDLADLERVRGTPAVLVALLSLLVVGTVGHAMTVIVRRGQRDLAMLRALGFVRRQLASTVRAESTSLSVLALIIGLPAGVVAGRVAWQAFAEGLGVEPVPQVPLLAAVVVVLLIILLTGVFSTIPARRVLRSSPARALRTG